jgi:dTDP-4-amino-4,6-dideoxygalactose transaminase
VRYQLPVSTPIALAGIGHALRASLLKADASVDFVRSELQRQLDGSSVALCDSGTSALVLALRAALPPGGTVALPSYACVDLAAAVCYAGVRVRLYDVEPGTLSADLDSLARALHRGVDAVLAAHLYGYPADIPAIADLARAHGVPVIEDAAQSAGATLHGRRLGAFGDLAILSFGRGKGFGGGGGGAVIASSSAWEARLLKVTSNVALSSPSGWESIAGVAARWVLGRPELYALPSAMPWLRLGEMVYHPAHEPESISRAAGALVRYALQSSNDEASSRRRLAIVLAELVEEVPDVATPKPIRGADPGYLRFPVLARDGREPAPSFGIVRGYPRPLFEQAELRPALEPNEPEGIGARELSASLFTLPVHSMVTERDVARIARWLRGHLARTR